MREFINGHFEHVLCGLLLLSRIGDVGSTYLVTPKMQLEANPLMKKLGWKFALLTLLVCFVPYYSTNMAVFMLVPFLFVTSANIGKIWFARAYGETEYRELLLQVARKSKLSHAIAGTIVSASFLALAGLVLLYLAPDPDHDWGYWFALGLILYAIIIGLYGSLFFRRIFKAARREAAPPELPVEARQLSADSQNAAGV